MTKNDRRNAEVKAWMASHAVNRTTAVRQLREHYQIENAVASLPEGLAWNDSGSTSEHPHVTLDTGVLITPESMSFGLLPFGIDTEAGITLDRWLPLCESVVTRTMSDQTPFAEAWRNAMAKEWRAANPGGRPPKNLGMVTGDIISKRGPWKLGQLQSETSLSSEILSAVGVEALGPGVRVKLMIDSYDEEISPQEAVRRVLKGNLAGLEKLGEFTGVNQLVQLSGDWGDIAEALATPNSFYATDGRFNLDYARSQGGVLGRLAPLWECADINPNVIPTALLEDLFPAHRGWRSMMDVLAGHAANPIRNGWAAVPSDLPAGMFPRGDAMPGGVAYTLDVIGKSPSHDEVVDMAWRLARLGRVRP